MEEAGGDGAAVEGQKCQLIRVTFRNSIEKFVNSVSEDSMSEILNDMCKERKVSCNKVYKYMTQSMTNNIMETIDKFFVSWNVEEKLAKPRFSDNKDIKWRPPGNVQEHMRTYYANELKKYNEALLKCIKEEETEVAFLKQQVSDMYAEIDNLKKQMNDMNDYCDYLNTYDTGLKKAMALLDT